jgi:hypothetical protein
MALAIAIGKTESWWTQWVLLCATEGAVFWRRPQNLSPLLPDAFGTITPRSAASCGATLTSVLFYADRRFNPLSLICDQSTYVQNLVFFRQSLLAVEPFEPPVAIR